LESGNNIPFSREGQVSAGFPLCIGTNVKDFHRTLFCGNNPAVLEKPDPEAACAELLKSRRV